MTVLLANFQEWMSKQQPPRPGLVPKSGDPRHPFRWIRPREEGVIATEESPSEKANQEKVRLEELSSELIRKRFRTGALSEEWEKFAEEHAYNLTSFANMLETFQDGPKYSGAKKTAFRSWQEANGRFNDRYSQLGMLDLVYYLATGITPKYSYMEKKSRDLRYKTISRLKRIVENPEDEEEKIIAKEVKKSIQTLKIMMNYTYLELMAYSISKGTPGKITLYRALSVPQTSSLPDTVFILDGVSSWSLSKKVTNSFIYYGNDNYLITTQFDLDMLRDLVIASPLSMIKRYNTLEKDEDQREVILGASPEKIFKAKISRVEL